MMFPRDENKKLIVQVVCLCLGWFVVSSLNSIIGKVTLNVFPFPMTITMIQLSSILIYLKPTLRYLRVNRTSISLGRRYYLHMIVPLAFAKFLASVSSHISLWKVPISYSHTVKSMMPLFVVILSRVILGEKQHFRVR
jgi:solute carrier family 35 protein E1